MFKRFNKLSSKSKRIIGIIMGLIVSCVVIFVIILELIRIYAG
ncbi:hypothetical protein TKV_c22550 [Thermoanaerobacter kivui]|uniref:Uncharacterized protein n=3 Tax=Thermoanaerobacter TaxID=1754 RepID=D3T5M8_THEIA|nr:hypothetical protein Thit_2187 [Thermoanaerobacter italicus Ab9]AIS53384.1 hypothetical protein TKV_c22550 [Thermoanaerobacter kivui]MDP9751932.1 tetrahydromethanopterin S-methyltransferase subunit F [Thermoanaerobacter pentosaceus]